MKGIILAGGKATRLFPGMIMSGDILTGWLI